MRFMLYLSDLWGKIYLYNMLFIWLMLNMLKNLTFTPSIIKIKRFEKFYYKNISCLLIKRNENDEKYVTNILVD